MPNGREPLPEIPASGIYKKGSLSYEGLMSTILRISEDGTGAIATYVGRVKSPGFAGRKVEELVIETDHERSGMALRQVCDEVKKKYGLQLAAVYHYEGSFRVGEILVMVVVAGKARPEVFSALEEVVRRFKPEANIRKKEVYEDGESEWIGK